MNEMKEETHFFVQDESVALHNVLAEDHGQELVVGDVLHDGGHDVARLLEDALVVPVRVDLSELGGDAVVFAQHDGVQRHQHHLLVDARITGQEAVRVLVGAGASGIRRVQFGRKQVFESAFAQLRVALEQTSFEGAQLVGRVLGRAVDEVGVQGARDGVEGGARTQTTRIAQSAGRPDELQTPAPEQRVERVVGGHLHRPARRVALVDGHVAALGFAVRRRICNIFKK